MTRIGVTKGLRGYYAVMYDVSTYEPIQTSPFSSDDEGEAAQDARDWAMAEQCSLEESVLKILNEDQQ